MDLVCEEDGQRTRNFTLYSRGQEWIFDTPKEVLAFVKAEPDREYTLYLGKNISLGSEEVEEITSNWRA